MVHEPPRAARDDPRCRDCASASADVVVPAKPAKAELGDEHRVFPGDGILPLEQCLKDLLAIDYRGCVSLELYNPEYWKRDPLEVAKEGREKSLAVIEKACGS